MKTEDFLQFDLDSVITSPNDGVTFVDGTDQFPAFRVSSNADIKTPYRIVLPDKLYEFAIMATIRADTQPDGYLFAVVNPLDTMVQLGIKLTRTSSNKLNITLIYADANSPPPNPNLVTFQVPYTKSWMSIAFKVLNDKVVFYHNCINTETAEVNKDPKELIFDSASTFYVAQAGPELKGKFEVSLFLC